MGSTIEEALERGEVDQDAVRAAFTAVRLEDTRPLTRVAIETGVAYPTLAAWVAGKYAGNNERVAADVQKWLNTREARKNTAATLPVAPTFKMTQTASQIFEVLEHAQTLPDMALVTGSGGVGKTSAIREYQRVASNVFIATMQPWVTTTKGVLDVISMSLGMMPSNSSLLQSVTLQRKLQGSGGLLILDEAQHLSPALLDQVRSIHDATEIGVVLAGNTTVFNRLGADQRTAQFSQLFSRIGMRINIDRPRKRDAQTMIDAWGISDPDARKTALGVALQPGALRGLTKTLRMAFAIAAAAGGNEPTAAQIEMAWQQLTQTGGRPAR